MRYSDWSVSQLHPTRDYSFYHTWLREHSLNVHMLIKIQRLFYNHIQLSRELYPSNMKEVFLNPGSTQSQSVHINMIQLIMLHD